MKIEIATCDDIPQIVSLHAAAFVGFFLTTLGDNFLYLLYREFISHPDSICLVAKSDSDDVVGFAVGTPAPSFFFKKTLIRHGRDFFSAAVPSLLKRPFSVVRKLISAVFYRGDMPLLQGVSKPVLLSSLAVHPSLKGAGAGRKLLEAFSIRAQEMGADAVYLTTDQYNNDSVNNFYISNGFSVDSTIRKSGGRVMYRYIKILRDDAA